MLTRSPGNGDAPGLPFGEPDEEGANRTLEEEFLCISLLHEALDRAGGSKGGWEGESE